MRKRDLVDGQAYAVWGGYGTFDSYSRRYSFGRDNEVSQMRKFVLADKSASRPVKISEHSKATADRPVIIGEQTKYDMGGRTVDETKSVFFQNAKNFIMLWEEWEVVSAPIIEKFKVEEKANKIREDATESVKSLLKAVGIEGTENGECRVNSRWNDKGLQIDIAQADFFGEDPDDDEEVNYDYEETIPAYTTNNVDRLMNVLIFYINNHKD